MGLTLSFTTLCAPLLLGERKLRLREHCRCSPRTAMFPTYGSASCGASVHVWAGHDDVGRHASRYLHWQTCDPMFTTPSLGDPNALRVRLGAPDNERNMRWQRHFRLRKHVRLGVPCPHFAHNLGDGGQSDSNSSAYTSSVMRANRQRCRCVP